MKTENLTRAAQAHLPEEVHGIAPLDLETCNRDTIPSDWNIVSVLGDILMCEYVDESDQGEVLRGGVWIQKNMVQYLWRVAKVIKAGPGVSGNIKVGDCIMIPSDKGIPGVTKDNKKIIFLNEPRVFAVVEPKE